MCCVCDEWIRSGGHVRCASRRQLVVEQKYKDQDRSSDDDERDTWLDVTVLEFLFGQSELVAASLVIVTVTVPALPQSVPLSDAGLATNLVAVALPHSVKQCKPRRGLPFTVPASKPSTHCVTVIRQAATASSLRRSRRLSHPPRAIAERVARVGRMCLHDTCAQLLPCSRDW